MSYVTLTRGNALAHWLTAVPVHVELHLSPGLPAIAMVGMPESIMREAKERFAAPSYRRLSLAR